MYDKFDLPTILFSKEPINRENLHLFVGRESDVKLIASNIRAKRTCFLIEGPVGCGKTSLGNYIRFSIENSFTPNSEISCEPNWGTKDLLLALQSNVLMTVRSPHSPYYKLMKQSVFENARTNLINTKSRGGGLNIASVGANYTESINQPTTLTPEILSEQLNEMIKLIKGEVSKVNKVDINDTRFIFQLNNLDPNHGDFSEDKIANFFNLNRDFLASGKIHASFIINGGPGIKAIATKKAKRFKSSSKSKTVAPLEFKDFKKALEIRAKSENHSGEIPFTEITLREVFNICGNNFRDTMDVLDSALTHYDSSSDYIENITTSMISDFYYAESFSEIERDIFKPNGNISRKGKILIAMTGEGSLSIAEIANLSSIDNSNTSKDIMSLEEKGIVLKERDGKNVYCAINPEYHFALMCQAFKNDPRLH